MFIIEANNDRNSWISGIFKDEELTKKYIEIIPEELLRNQRIKTLETIEYPFYIIEIGDKFYYINNEEIEEKIKSIVVEEDKEHVYFNLYFIPKDYQPKDPGTDNMGMINHVHIDNRFLEYYKEYGKDILTRNRMA
ncbi:hypothetical protein [Paenibacillus sp. NFR01]|uniref:hypothetical protein n=1 Tax=Paenibacillus sp. NFR01 TaxID=1566279 RepID=UPI0008CEA3FD|nr:hypothetical protein [Paenibacillus sp. NFR01]SEU33026.1 hypothetical protein SAMN03159358_0177 [Paenibacillus sp. NFR01]